MNLTGPTPIFAWMTLSCQDTLKTLIAEVYVLDSIKNADYKGKVERSLLYYSYYHLFFCVFPGAVAVATYSKIRPRSDFSEVTSV